MNRPLRRERVSFVQPSFDRQKWGGTVVHQEVLLSVYRKRQELFFRGFLFGRAFLVTKNGPPRKIDHLRTSRVRRTADAFLLSAHRLVLAGEAENLLRT